MEEKWRKVERFKRIEVSDQGNVRTVWDDKIKVLKPMKMKTTVGSYLKVSVTNSDDGKQRQIGIHNLVAEAFIPKPEVRSAVKLEPNHKDGDKHNNTVSNLEWTTRQQNLQHAIDTGLRQVVDNRGKCLYIDRSKPVKVVDVEINESKVYDSAKDASIVTGVPPRTVQYNAFKRENKKPVKGYLFLPVE